MTGGRQAVAGRRRPVVVDGYLRHEPDEATAFRECSEIRRWVEVRGWRLARLHQDVAPSQSRLREAISRVQARESNGVVAGGLMQLGRTLDDALAMVERIQAAGGVFVSVHDRLDLSTPTGRRRHRQLLATVSSAPSEAGAGGRCSPPRPRSRPRSRPRAR